MPCSFKLSKSLAEFAADAANKVKSFLAAACTWTKTLLRLQVWNLFANGEQIMRAADCKKLAEKAEGLFRQAQQAPHIAAPVFIDPSMQDKAESIFRMEKQKTPLSTLHTSLFIL